jgi:predicted HD superfamily hydrolase involved in NAD metabolism
MHDVMKEKSQEYMLNIFNFYNFKLNETQQSNPKVWHGLAGAIYIEKILKIDIKHIINAVKYHTVPRKNMTQFEKIIFLADRISDDRIYKDVNVLRNLAKKDLNAAILYSLKNTISSLLKKENTISTPTIECYNNLILKKRRKSKYANKS